MSKAQLTAVSYRTSPIFFFKCYDKVIGSAANVKELLSEMRRLEYEDPAALKYHLSQGHVVAWLRSVNETELAADLEGVDNISLAERIVEEFLETEFTYQRMREGRMH